MASPDECLVNERVMGECNHPDCCVEEERSYGYTYEIAVCSRCGLRASVKRPLFEELPNDPLAALKDTIQPHFLDMVMVRRVLRSIEAGGGTWSRARRDGLFQYSIRKGVTQVSGVESRIEKDAITDAIVKFAKLLPAHGTASKHRE